MIFSLKKYLDQEQLFICFGNIRHLSKTGKNEKCHGRESGTATDLPGKLGRPLEYINRAPQIWGGGCVCQHFAQGGVCQFLDKIQPKTCKHPFCTKKLIRRALGPSACVIIYWLLVF